MDNRSKEIFDLVSHTIFNNIGYDNLTNQQREVVKLEILKRKLI